MTAGTSSASKLHAEKADFTLSGLQCAWLAEIGLDRRMLAQYRQVGDPAVSPQSGIQETGVAAVGKLPHDDSGSGSEPRVRSAADLARKALKQAHERPASSAVQGGLESVGRHLAEAGAARAQDLPEDWAALNRHASLCQACDLQAERDQLVFGAGDTDQPDWLIVGEAPSQADDRTGQPFQGAAGQLLHAMLVAAGVHPVSVVLGGEPQVTPAWSQPVSMYFSNLVKCRPLGNRSPAPSEVASCIPYLMQQIELLQPRGILALGRLAAQALLRVDADVDDLRGKVHYLTSASGRKIPLVVTWHPASLLVHPQNKGPAWADLNLAKQLRV